MARPKKDTTVQRLKSGEFKEDEPSQLEIMKASVNYPVDKSIQINEKFYPVVELGFIQWKTYITELSKAFQEVLKELSPLYESIMNGWGVFKNFSSATLAELREQIPSLDPEIIQGIIANMGVKISLDQAQALKDNSGNMADFSTLIGSFVYQPLLGNIKKLGISEILEKAAGSLPDLVLATLTSSFNRSGVKYNIEELRNEVLTYLDGFDMLNIVWKQIELYQERGKIRSFFAQVTKQITKLGSVMPTA